jgi:hypothetical protein
MRKKCIPSLVRKPEGKRPFGRPGRILENIRMDLEKSGGKL